QHFPGHGATVSDSHLELPKLDIDITLLEQRELRPFKSLIEIGLSLVMTAHVLYPKIDVHPATLSSVILKDILRKKMNYTGVVISDDLEMKALSNMTVENKAISAFSAGVDILLEAYPPENTLALDVACRMGRGVVHAIEKGVIAEAEIDGSHKRIDALVARLGNLSNLTIASDGKELRELLKDIIIA
nr:hypothetical protein [Pseudomonadota bacterium]